MKYITGDLIEQSEEFDVIVHGRNCFCTMGAGIALQIKYKFPEAHMVDIQTQYGNKDKLGTITYTKNTKPIIVNAYTQYKYTRDDVDADYNAIRTCMKEIKNKFNGKKIGMPLIGAGLAGGDWNKISKIIEEELSGEDVTIVKYNKL